MALQWDFREKAGTVTESVRGNSFTFPFYEGNALMIVTHEFVDESDGQEKYDMRWFFIGVDHAKNCLGLSKGHDNMFGSDGVTNLTIYRANCRQYLKLVELFTKAFPGVTVTLLPDDPDAKHEEATDE